VDELIVEQNIPIAFGSQLGFLNPLIYDYAAT
jgi:hypothetical protein